MYNPKFYAPSCRNDNDQTSVTLTLKQAGGSKTIETLSTTDSSPDDYIKYGDKPLPAGKY